ncbi:MAG TPA: Nif3-like dinuclear metal center hexameric protein [Candidatus Dorea intestinavium]|nr:Nif3-like dinuclear metal center hexameric protein [Candidatus Dorea intestinavium]
MNCKDIIEKIEEKYQLSYACDWDNVGLLVGREEKEVKTIYIALDATKQVVERAISNKADLLITHHPMIFSGLKRVNDKDLVGSKVVALLQNDITYYAAHTNYDVKQMADLAAKKLRMEETKVLEITKEEEELGIGLYGNLPEPVSIRELGELIKNKFHIDTVKIFGDLNKKVTNVAISPGSGKSMITPSLEVGAEVLITGDIDHHTGIDAVDEGLLIIDAGHYGLEHIFIKDMARFVSELSDDFNIIREPLENPFVVI